MTPFDWKMKLMDDQCVHVGWPLSKNGCHDCAEALFAQAITAAVEAEREACATTLEAFRDQGAMSIGWFGMNVIRKALDAIRARGAK